MKETHQYFVDAHIDNNVCLCVAVPGSHNNLCRSIQQFTGNNKIHGQTPHVHAGLSF